jgi:peptidoglycan/LPS O-acetylase OafA/YrhL
MTNDTHAHQSHVTHLPYRADIDGLRALAVIVVILFHAFPNIFGSGFIGVDIFFVISGYLISSFILKNLFANSFNFASFYSRRVNRIFPALLFILITLLCLSWYYLIPDDFSKVSKHVFGSSTFLSNIVYLSEAGYFDDAADQKPLLHLWSLAIEEQFYIIWPITLALAFRFRLEVVKLIIFALLFSFALNIYRASYDTNFAFFSLQTRAWELLLGGFIAYIDLRLSASATPINRYVSNAVSFTGAALIVAGLVLITKDVRFPGWWALLPTIGAACMIAAGPLAFINRHLLALPPLRAIGLISYPLYLWHWVLLSFVAVLLNHPLDMWMTLGLVGASIGLACLTYLAIERPIRQHFNNGKTTLILLILMVCLGAIGLYGYKHHGILGQTKQGILINDTGIYPCKDKFDAKQICIFGNLDSSEVILIYGDSHAEHLTAALAKTFGDTYKLMFAYTSSCYFGEHPNPKYKRPIACEPFVEHIRDLKKSGEKIVATILSQRWHGYGITMSEQIIAAMTDAMKAFDLNPNKIIIVGSTANVDLRCAKHNYYFGSSRSQQPCERDETSIKINKDFIAITSAMPAPRKVAFVYPYTILCPNDICTPIQGDILLYGDTHHLTRAGADLVMPTIKALIDEAAIADSPKRH